MIDAETFLSRSTLFLYYSVARMKVLSSDFRIGFGSFIDKTVAPFADTIK